MQGLSCTRCQKIVKQVQFKTECEHTLCNDCYDGLFITVMDKKNEIPKCKVQNCNKNLFVLLKKTKTGYQKRFLDRYHASISVKKSIARKQQKQKWKQSENESQSCRKYKKWLTILVKQIREVVEKNAKTVINCESIVYQKSIQQAILQEEFPFSQELKNLNLIQSLVASVKINVDRKHCWINFQDEQWSKAKKQELNLLRELEQKLQAQEEQQDLESQYEKGKKFVMQQLNKKKVAELQLESQNKDWQI